MKKTKRQGRASFVTRKETSFTSQAQEGGRQSGAYWASVFLDMIARSGKPIPSTGTVADWLLPLLVQAWKSRNARFFSDIVSTIKNKRTAETIHADLTAHKLLVHFFDDPIAEQSKRCYSAAEIQKICGHGISERKAREYANDLSSQFGLKRLPRGRPKK